MEIRFLCLFVDTLPVNTYLHIWDAFLFEGSKVRCIISICPNVKTYLSKFQTIFVQCANCICLNQSTLFTWSYICGLWREPGEVHNIIEYQPLFGGYFLDHCLYVGEFQENMQESDKYLGQFLSQLPIIDEAGKHIIECQP